MDTLIEELSSSDRLIRLQAQQELIRLGASAVEPLLLKLAASRDDHQRAAIVAVLAEISDTRSIGALIDCLDRGNLLLRMIAAEALANFRDPGVFAALSKRLPTESVVVQIWIVLALGKIGNRHAVALLARLLHSMSSPALRCAILQALGELGGETARKHITACLHDQDDHVRSAARLALKQVTPEE